MNRPTLSLVLFLAVVGIATSASAQQEPEVLTWLDAPLTHETIAEGVELLKECLIDEQARVIVLDRLHSRRRAMPPEDLRLMFAGLFDLATDTVQPSKLRARAVDALAAQFVLIQEQKHADRIDTASLFAFLTRVAPDLREPLEVRGRALRALGLLKVEGAATLLRSILDLQGAVDEPELARNACLGLAYLRDESAVNDIAAVLKTTKDKSVFGTASFSLGQLPSAASVIALVQNEKRFPDSASPDAVLVDMEPVILEMLRQPLEPHRTFAIEATRHLWKEGQRERYTPMLRDLVLHAPLPTRKAALERLIEDAGQLPFREEQRQLAMLLPEVAPNPALADYARRIEDRLAAKLVEPDAYAVPQETIELGNRSAQEYADAVYRYLAATSWAGYNYNHAGLYAGQASGVKRVIEADTFSGDTTKDNSFSTSFTSFASNYYGAFQLSNTTLTFSQRKAIVSTGQQIADAYIYYTFANAIDPISSTRPIAISNIDNIRCDGVVEYCYEANGRRVWWSTSNSARWDITNYPAEHNDMPDVTVNPGTEMSPWAQRGAPSSTSEGPGFTGTNPNNTYLKNSASITYPTYEVTQSSRTSNTTVNVQIRATDVSGISFISYMLPGSTTWVQSSYGPQHPTSDSMSITVAVTTNGTLQYYAQDNGGNQPNTPYPQKQFYRGTSSAGSGGSISPSGAYLVMAGESIYYSASPNSGYTVDQWLVDGSAVQNGGTTFTLSNLQANRTVQVTFRAPTRVIRLGGDLAFGDVTVGQTATRTLTIYNDGNSTLTVSSITYPSRFSGDWNGGPISAGSSRNVTVTFAPTSAASYGGTITVSSDATNGTNTRSCSGNGVALPTRVIRLGGDLSFGSVTVGQTATRTLTIYNDGNSTLSVSGISYPPGFSGNWSGTVGAGSSQPVTVTFAPSSVTTYGGTVTVSSDKTGGTNTTSCSGSGVSAPTRIIRLGGDLNFGNVSVGQTATRTLTIYNDGSATLSVYSISYPSGFSGNWSGSVSAGSSQDVSVTFAPSSAMTYSGTVSVSSDKTGGTNTTSCSGTGVTVNCLGLSTSVNPPGTGSVTVGTQPNCGGWGYNAGTPIALTANTPSGYTFSGWTGSGGGFSSQTTQTTFTISANASVTANFSATNNPVPSITSVSPSTVTAGDAAFALTVDGTGFIAASLVFWNGNQRQTSYVSSTRLTAAISVSDIANAGTGTVTVVNPAPGGGTSNAATVTIQPGGQCSTTAISSCPYSVSRSLTSSACTNGKRGATYYTDRYSFNGVQGTTAVIRLSSLEFDTYLYLVAPDGTTVAFNDDSDGTTNSTISAALTSTGTWTIEATSYFDWDTGAYSLSLACEGTLATPSGLVVTYNHALFGSTPGVDVRWNAVSGAVNYEADVNGFVLDLATSSTSIGIYGLTEPVCYSIRLRAVGATGQRSAWSSRDIATSIVFTDDPLVTRTTPVKAAHMNELRAAVATVRSAAGLPAFSFSSSIAPGGPIRAAHPIETRNALNEALSVLGLSAVTFSDPVAGVTTMRGNDLQRLRDAMK